MVKRNSDLLKKISQEKPVIIIDVEWCAARYLIEKSPSHIFSKICYLDLSDPTRVNGNILAYSSWSFFEKFITHISEYLFSDVSNSVFNSSLKQIFVQISKILASYPSNNLSIFHISHFLSNDDALEEMLRTLPESSYLKNWARSVFCKLQNYQKSDYILTLQNGVSRYATTEGEILCGGSWQQSSCLMHQIADNQIVIFDVSKIIYNDYLKNLFIFIGAFLGNCFEKDVYFNGNDNAFLSKMQKYTPYVAWGFEYSSEEGQNREKYLKLKNDYHPCYPAMPIKFVKDDIAPNLLNHNILDILTKNYDIPSVKGIQALSAEQNSSAEQIIKKEYPWLHEENNSSST